MILHCGDCLEVLKTLADNSVDACVTDPPYGLQFMGKEWDKLWRNEREADIAYVERTAGELTSRARKLPDYSASNPQQMQIWHEAWALEVLRVLKPGGHLVAFSGTRTYHRMACAIEDAGFEVRDQLAFCYGTGFPKSRNISKDLHELRCTCEGVASREATAGQPQPQERRAWDHCERCGKPMVPDGLGSALKPAWEPICLARKPLSEKTVAANVLRWGTGAINVDGCRISSVGEDLTRECLGRASAENEGWRRPWMDGAEKKVFGSTNGRFPANLCHDGSQEVLDLFPETRAPASGGDATPRKIGTSTDIHGTRSTVAHGDMGSAARYFYCAKASKADRAGSKHPTVKPVSLMQWLCRLVTPAGGIVLDPFAGSGTTGAAAALEGFGCILIEREAEYIADIRRRLNSADFYPSVEKAS
jgi:DNA modification methylase